MRGNEWCEDIISVAVLMILVPMVFLFLLVSGIALLYASPFVIIALIALFFIWLKKRDKPKMRLGTVKLITIPKPLATVLMAIVKIVLGFLIVAAYLWVMINIPVGIACIITLSLIGFATGKKLSS